MARGEYLGAQRVLRALMARSLAKEGMVVGGRILSAHDDHPPSGIMAFMPVFSKVHPAAILADLISMNRC